MQARSRIRDSVELSRPSRWLCKMSTQLLRQVLIKIRQDSKTKVFSFVVILKISHPPYQKFRNRRQILVLICTALVLELQMGQIMHLKQFHLMLKQMERIHKKRQLEIITLQQFQMTLTVIKLILNNKSKISVLIYECIVTPLLANW
eukprot:NODE_32_length_37098_cov_1.132760.p26 type:complete len:147 gc:universal NODE_32_length_37098_cov_1.132760:121-561(+)